MNRMVSIAGMAIIALTIGTTGPIFAAGYAKADAGAGEIAYRKDLMKAVGGHMGAMKGIIKGTTGNKANFAAHAQGMLGLAKITGSAFPKGSGPESGKTRALPKVWEDAAGFQKAIDAFVAESEKLVKAVESGDMKAAGAQFAALGKDACGTCHKAYRAEKKK